MISINPYLNFLGNTEAAMKFYKSVFGVNFLAFQRFNEYPGHEKMPEKEQTMIMHASLPMGKNNVLSATDALESMQQKLVVGNNIYLSINTESEEEATSLFEQLSEDGRIEMPLNKTFWASYAGMCQDKFGIHWMINYTEPK